MREASTAIQPACPLLPGLPSALPLAWCSCMGNAPNKLTVCKFVHKPLLPNLCTLPEKPSKTDEMAWIDEHDACTKKQERHETNKAKVFALVFGQCDEHMKNRLKALETHTKADEDRDVVTLLELIKGVVVDVTFASNKGMETVGSGSPTTRR